MHALRWGPVLASVFSFQHLEYKPLPSAFSGAPRGCFQETGRPRRPSIPGWSGKLISLEGAPRRFRRPTSTFSSRRCTFRASCSRVPASGYDYLEEVLQRAEVLVGKDGTVPPLRRQCGWLSCSSVRDRCPHRRRASSGAARGDTGWSRGPRPACRERRRISRLPCRPRTRTARRRPTRIRVCRCRGTGGARKTGCKEPGGGQGCVPCYRVLTYLPSGLGNPKSPASPAGTGALRCPNSPP